MGKILLIVESPAKCKKIESFLGPNYKCIASFGHIRELMTQKGLKCIDIDKNYTPLYQIALKQKKNVTAMKKEISNCDDVLLATDDDREGEAIAWHICEVCNLNPNNTKRIIFHEITKQAIQKAVLNPIKINMDMVNSQKARQVLDLLVGFTISPVLWKNISSNKKSSLSAGRCQTPALRLVYENQIEIDNNPGKKCYTITGYFTKNNINYVLSDDFEEKEKCEEFLEKSVNHCHKMTNTKPEQIEKTPPKPLTTSDLQQKASSILHYSPKKTMSICQKLYENGYITYMRTDSRYYSNEFIESTEKYIEKHYKKEFIKKDLFTLSLNTDFNQDNNERKTTDNVSLKATKTNKKKKEKENISQEAHEAIRPTKIETEFIEKKENIGNEEIKMYKLIWNITIESCMSNSIYSRFLSTISSPNESKYKYTCEEVIFPGWEIIQGYEKHNKLYHYLLKVDTSKEIKYNKIKALYSIRELKTHYTEAKIISLLEKKGIGRPSTFSSILSKIEERGYVKKENIKGKEINCIDFELIDDEINIIENKRIFGEEKNKIVLQPIGKIVIEYLLKHYSKIFEYNYTMEMEKELDKIAKGNKTWYLLCDECYKDINEINKEIKKEEKEKETIINDEYKFIIARYGAVLVKKENGTIKYLKIKKEIDIEKLKNGEILPEDAILKEKINNSLGKYKEKNVILKKGKFGLYINYNDINISLNCLKKDEEEISLEDVIPYIEKENKSSKDENIIRIINDDISIRKGKYGDYIFYKTNTMKKPKFIPCKKIKLDYMNCDIELIKDFITNN
jgi:DNA topoisomerase I